MKEKNDTTKVTQMSNYSINQVVKLAGISASLLRKYEDSGLLKPKRDKSSQYRQYSPADVNRILQIRQLRKLNIPLNEIKNLFNEDDSHKYAALLEQYQNLLRKRIEQEQIVDAYLTHTIEMLTNIPGEINYQKLPSQTYQVYQNEENMIFDIEKSGEVSWMINKQATAYMAILLPDYDDENFGKTYQVIVSFPDHLNQHQNDPKYEHLPTGLYAYTTVQTEFHLLYDHIRLAQEKIKKDGYTIHGRIIVEINSSADLYTLYMPVRK